MQGRQTRSEERIVHLTLDSKLSSIENPLHFIFLLFVHQYLFFFIELLIRPIIYIAILVFIICPIFLRERGLSIIFVILYGPMLNRLQRLSSIFILGALVPSSTSQGYSLDILLILMVYNYSFHFYF